MAYETTMKDLVVKVHKVFVDNKNKLPLLKTFKNGVLPPLPAFPALSILPETDIYIYGISGGKYKVRRNLSIQLITKGLNKRVNRDQLTEMMDGISRIIRDNSTFEDVCYDSFIEVQDLDDPVEKSNSILSFGVMHLSCLSYETLPVIRFNTVDLYESRGSHLLSQIYDKFIEYKNHPTYPLTALKSLNIQVMKPTIAFPSVLISEMGADRRRRLAGIDLIDRDVRIEIFTKLLDKDFALFSNLDITERIKRILQIDTNLSGATIDSNILRIDYTRTRSDTAGLLYNSIISYSCITQEYLTQEEVMNEKDKKSW